MLKHPTPDPDVRVEGIEPEELEALFDRLVGYAITRLRLTLRRRPTRDEVDDLVQDVAEAALEGRRWPESGDSWEYLCGIVWSAIGTQCRSDRRRRAAGKTVPLEEADEKAGPSSRKIEGVYAREMLPRVLALVAEDPELSALIDAWADENDKPAEVASVLDCTTAHVEALVKRLRRRTDAAGLYPWSKDEDETERPRDGRSDRGAAPPRRRPRRPRAG